MKFKWGYVVNDAGKYNVLPAIITTLLLASHMSSLPSGLLFSLGLSQATRSRGS